MIASLTQQFAFNAWANAILLNTFEGAPRVPSKSVAALQHVYATEVTWLRRLRGENVKGEPLWGPPSLHTCREYAPVATQLVEFVDRLRESDLDQPLAYRNSRGEDFEDPIGDLLAHILIHSAQYRGEAAGFANAADFNLRVPDLDYIYYLRMQR